METLAELIETNNIRSTWFYNHSKENPGHGDNDVFDVLLTIDAGTCLYGGISNQRTLLVHSYHQSISNSQTRHGGNLIPPTTVEVLGAIASNASGVDANGDDWQEWAREYVGSDIAPGEKPGDLFNRGLNARGEWEDAKRARDELFVFLGSEEGEQWSLYERVKRAAAEE